jgi:hypothetical protein
MEHAALRVSIAFLAIVVPACATAHGTLLKSAQANYAGGNLDGAVINLAGSLRLKPDYTEAQTLIREVYPKAVEAHLDKINESRASASAFKWDRVVAEYAALSVIDREVKSLPSGVRLVVADRTTAAAEAKSSAAEEHYREGRHLFGTSGMSNRDQAASQFRLANSYVAGYKDANALTAEGYYQEGVLLSKQSSVDAQKTAAKAFTAAQQAVPGYKDASTAYEKARKAGVKRLAIVPFEDRSGKGGHYGDMGATIVDGVVSSVMNDPQAMEFLEIVSRDQLEQVLTEQRLGSSGLLSQQTAAKVGQLLGAQEILTGGITQIVVSPERTTTTVIEQKNQVCDHMQKVADSKGRMSEQCVYVLAVAQVTMYSRKASATIAGSYKVIDIKTGTVKETQQLGGSCQFTGEWAVYVGDVRALSGEPQRLTTLREQPAPTPEELVSKAGEDLTAKLSRSLKAYAR